MKITLTKRSEFQSRAYRGGYVSPEKSYPEGFDGPEIERDAYAKGVVWHGQWFELPDQPAGEYEIVEILDTNAYGHVTSTRAPRSIRPYGEPVAGLAGVVNRLAKITVFPDLSVTAAADKLRLFRKQG